MGKASNRKSPGEERPNNSNKAGSRIRPLSSEEPREEARQSVDGLARSAYQSILAGQSIEDIGSQPREIRTLAEPVTPTGLCCFVIMPFRERDANRAPGFFDEVLRKLIAPAGSRAGFTVSTALKHGTEIIHSTIVNDLLDADLAIADLTEHNPNVLFELGMRMAHDKPVVLIRAMGTGPIFDVDNMLRVLEYNPNLWSSTIERDLPKLVAHIESTWNNRHKDPTYIKLLRRLPASGGHGKTEIHEFLSNDRGIIGKLLESTHEELSKAIKVDEHGFVLLNPALAIYSYVKFWELLVEEQRSRRLKPLNLEVIHSCEIDIWTDHPLTERLIDRQKKFRELGGVITRILCGRGGKPSPAFVKAYKNMLRANIDVRYYNYEDGVIDHTFAWDFLRVRETGHAVIWASFARGEVIEEAIYTNAPRYKGKHLAKMFKDILDHSNPFPNKEK